MKQEIIHVTDTHASINHDLRCDGGREIQWIGADGTVRIPEETIKDFVYPGLFVAAGKVYTSWKSLCIKQEDSDFLYKDIYGREVFYDAELFPCFDSYDYANETRHYRWFFIREKGKLTRVYYTDGRRQIQVTENVRNLENRCLEPMQKLGWIK